jgi:hypothetical protein
MQNQLLTNPPAIICEYRTGAPVNISWVASSAPDEEKIITSFFERAISIANHAISKLHKKYPYLVSSNK